MRKPRPPASIVGLVAHFEAWCRRPHARWGVLAGILLVTALAYGNTLGNAFVFDDYTLVVENPRLQSLRGIGDAFELRGAPRRGPVTTLSYAIDHSVAGLNPWMYHLSNLVYHALTALLVFLVVAHITGAAHLGAVVALLFLVHPAQTGAVAYVSGRHVLLGTLFFMVGFYCFLRCRHGAGPGTAALALVAYVAALLASVPAVVLPAVCLLHDAGTRWTERGGRPGPGLRTRRRAIRLALRGQVGLYAGFALAAGAYLGLELFGPSPAHAAITRDTSLATLLGTDLRLLVHFLGLLVWPVTLSADYSYNHFPASAGLLETRVILSALVVGLLVAVGLGWSRRRRLAAFGIFWLLVTLLAASRLVHDRPLLEENCLYLPLIGAALVAAAGCRVLERRVGHAATVTLVLLVAALFAARTIVRNRDYHDPETFWSATVRTAPDCARAHHNLGLALSRRGQDTAAKREFERALAIDPGYALAHYNLGFLYQKEGSWAAAAKAYRAALAHAGGLAPAMANLSVSLSHLGRDEEALTVLRKAATRWPRDMMILTRLADLYRARHNREAERAALVRLAAAHPEATAAAIRLGRLALERQAPDQALVWFRQARAGNPDDGRAYLYLADCLARLAQPRKALDVYRDYLRRWPRSPKRHLIARQVARIFSQLEDTPGK